MGLMFGQSVELMPGVSTTAGVTCASAPQSVSRFWKGFLTPGLRRGRKDFALGLLLPYGFMVVAVIMLILVLGAPNDATFPPSVAMLLIASLVLATWQQFILFVQRFRDTGINVWVGLVLALGATTLFPPLMFGVALVLCFAPPKFGDAPERAG